MRDLLSILDHLTEATVANYPIGTNFNISGSQPGQKLSQSLEQQGIDVEGEQTSVDNSTIDLTQVSAQYGTPGGTFQAFSDESGQLWIYNGGASGMNSCFVHAGKLANKGEIAEGILGAAMFAKFTKREPGEEIGIVTPQDVTHVLNQLQSVGNDTYQVLVDDTDNDFADTITFKLVLKTGPYKDLMDPTKRDALKNEYESACAYVNGNNAERYSKYFYFNGKSDDIAIIADGTSSEKTSKVDVWVAIKGADGNIRRLRLNTSLKTGPVKQFGQVSGRGKDTMIKLWNYFGIDISHLLDDFEKLSKKDELKAIEHVYKNVAEDMASKLKRAGPRGEATLVERIATAVEHFATLGDTGVELIHFDKSGFVRLNFANLAAKFKTIDLTATLKTGKATPEISIHDVRDPKNELIGIRSKREKDKHGDWYWRNYIEKGHLLGELTQVEQKTWADVEKKAQHAEKIGKAHTIGKLRSKRSAPGDLGRARR